MTSLYIKIGAAVALLAAVFGLGWHLGSMGPKVALAELQMAQAAAVAEAVVAEQAKSKAETERLNKVLATYEQASLTPIPDVAGRLYKYVQASGCTLPSTPTHPGGTLSPRPIPSSLEPATEALDGYIQACSRDALRLNALIDAWPR